MLYDDIDSMIDDNTVEGYPAPYHEIATHLGYDADIHIVDKYDTPGVRSALNSTLFDHYVVFVDSLYTNAYVYSQPYGPTKPIGTEVEGWTLVYTNDNSLYNQRPMTAGASTSTELWHLDISDFHLYRKKNTKKPYFILNTKLDESDRKFKQLIHIRREDVYKTK